MTDARTAETRTPTDAETGAEPPDDEGWVDSGSWALVQGAPAALSVRQPWAWALVNGHKDIENRTWQTTQRGFIAIHAGRRPDPAGFRFCEASGLQVPEDLAFGAVVGAVELLDVVERHRSPWASPQGYNWVIGRAFPISPIPMVGRLGIFGVPPAVAEALLYPPGDACQ
jgi:ASCH domain